MISSFLAVIPSWLLFIILVCGSFVLAYASLLFIRRKWKGGLVETRDNGSIGFIFSTVGVLYTVLLAFLVVTVWQSFNEAQRAVSQEAADVVTIARYSASFPEPVRSEVHDRLHRYTEIVINSEWQIMQKRIRGNTKNIEDVGSVQAMNEIQGVWELIQQKLPPNAISAAALNRVSELGRDRVLRLLSGENITADYLWFILLLLNVVVIYLSLILRVEDARLHLVLVELLATTIALLLWMIATINSPFTGEIQVSSEPFRYALYVIDSLPR